VFDFIEGRAVAPVHMVVLFVGFVFILGMELQASPTLGQHTTTEPHISPCHTL
jgi:hypothetical protein